MGMPYAKGGAADGCAGASESGGFAGLSDLQQNQLSHVLYWRFFINLALMLCDAAMFILAGACVLNLHGTTGYLAMWRWGGRLSVSLYLTVGALIWIACLRASGVYHRHVMGDGYQLNMLVFKGVALSWVGLCALNFVLGLGLSLGGVTLIVVSAWLATVIERVITRMIITRSRSKGAYSYGTVIVGSPEGIGRTLRFLARRDQLNYRPVAVCPIRLDSETGLVEADPDIDAMNRIVGESWGSPIPVIPYADHGLAERFVNLDAQTVMVCDVLHRFSDNFNIFSVRMESLGLELALITSSVDVAGHQTQVRSIQGTTVLTIRLAQYGVTTRIVKRLFDIVVSSLAILCSLIITLPVAIAIKLTDGGPIFYTQERIGLRGNPFRMIKFRSMVVNADELKAKLAEQTGQRDRFIFKMKDDPRITKVGHFIRRFSIDELPQFLNVFVGDMSVVGPRPPLPEEYARYNRIYAMRMLVKPGITGPWQVSGRSDLSAEESEQLDVAYVQNWSILGDIVLMFRTVGAVLGHKGAY
ncbi:sugar transferase [Bifidobacterium simiiventris]|uniref:sugar transferase n=1 Tax=Bifidobacterium simiiventris TaxID=2834434 RepID=UPI001F28981B|nr:sugar transferase [Bifidobacterium simiiventris]